MLAEIGSLFIAMALLVSVFTALPKPWVARIGIPPSVHAPVFLSALQWALVASAFLVLITLFVDSDFTVAIVATHSHTQKPLIYKIAAAWGQHEGSMLLWACVLATMGAALALWKPHHPLTHEALRIQAALLCRHIGLYWRHLQSIWPIVSASSRRHGAKPNATRYWFSAAPTYVVCGLCGGFDCVFAWCGGHAHRPRKS